MFEKELPGHEITGSEISKLLDPSERFFCPNEKCCLITPKTLPTLSACLFCLKEEGKEFFWLEGECRKCCPYVVSNRALKVVDPVWVLDDGTLVRAREEVGPNPRHFSKAFFMYVPGEPSKKPLFQWHWVLRRWEDLEQYRPYFAQLELVVSGDLEEANFLVGRGLYSDDELAAFPLKHGGPIRDKLLLHIQKKTQSLRMLDSWQTVVPSLGPGSYLWVNLLGKAVLYE